MQRLVSISVKASKEWPLFPDLSLQRDGSSQVQTQPRLVQYSGKFLTYFYATTEKLIRICRVYLAVAGLGVVLNVLF